MVSESLVILFGVRRVVFFLEFEGPRCLDPKKDLISKPSQTVSFGCG